MRTAKKRKIFAALLTMIVVILLIGSNLQRIQAHNFARFLTQPYYGNAARSRGWSQNSHYGIDFILRWQSVVAAADGQVDQSRWDDPSCHDELECPTGTRGGLGLRVRIRHDNINGEVNYTHYGHLSVARPLGQVSQGEWIGASGDSGKSCERLLPDSNQCDPSYPHGPHLHFEVTHVCGDPTSACSVNPDNAGGEGVPLWSNGEWSGDVALAPTPVARANRRYITLGTFGGETIVDDSTTNTSTFAKGCASVTCPYWYAVTTAGNNTDYLWTYDSDTSTDYWAEWRPNLPSASNYEVLAWMPCGAGGTTTNSNMTIWSAYYYVQSPSQALFGPIKVDQYTLSQYDNTDFRRGCNRWIGLGVYDFPAGTGGVVRVEDGTDETGSNGNLKVAADAVKFVRVNIGWFEAENPFKRVRKVDATGTSHEWIPYVNPTGIYGGQYVSARPNAGSSVTTDIETYSPKIRFNVIFPTAGTYHIWIRGYAGNTWDDSVHAGMNGLVSSTADRISCSQWQQPQWYWCKNTTGGSPATIYVGAPGAAIFELWMREDGFNADKIVITKDPGYDANTTGTNQVPYIFPGDDVSIIDE